MFLATLLQSCPPTEPPGSRPPNWCEAANRAGGWGQVVAVVAVAVAVAMVTFLLVRRIDDRNSRFWILGAVVYLLAGFVSTAMGNVLIGKPVSEMFSYPGVALLQILTWPYFLVIYMTDSWGR